MRCLLALVNLIFTQRGILGVILGDPALLVLDANVRNDLVLLVRGHEVDLVGNVHVPVDAFGRARGGISAARLDEHPYLVQRVLLIVGVVREDFELATIEFLRPMALLAGFLRGTQILYRRGNRPREGIEDGGKNLAAARELRLHKPRRAWSYVAIRASHAGMWRELVRGVFRAHDGVAQLSTEPNRLGEFVGFVAACRAHDDEYN